MPRTKTGEFNQIAYQNEFNKRNYDRIEIKVPKGRKAVIKAAATAAGPGPGLRRTSRAVREGSAQGRSRTARSVDQ